MKRSHERYQLFSGLGETNQAEGVELVVQILNCVDGSSGKMLGRRNGRRVYSNPVTACHSLSPSITLRPVRFHLMAGSFFKVQVLQEINKMLTEAALEVVTDQSFGF